MTTDELIFLVEEDPEGGYSAKALGQSIFVQADTFETLKDNIKDALDAILIKKEDIPGIIRLYIWFMTSIGVYEQFLSSPEGL
jgi:predicted RNase H-like HicB family nuclease